MGYHLPGTDPGSGKRGGTLLKKKLKSKKKKKKKVTTIIASYPFTKYIISRMLCKIKSYS